MLPAYIIIIVRTQVKKQRKISSLRMGPLHTNVEHSTMGFYGTPPAFSWPDWVDAGTMDLFMVLFWHRASDILQAPFHGTVCHRMCLNSFYLQNWVRSTPLLWGLSDGEWKSMLAGRAVGSCKYTPLLTVAKSSAQFHLSLEKCLWTMIDPHVCEHTDTRKTGNSAHECSLNDRWGYLGKLMDKLGSIML